MSVNEDSTTGLWGPVDEEESCEVSAATGELFEEGGEGNSLVEGTICITAVLFVTTGTTAEYSVGTFSVSKSSADWVKAGATPTDPLLTMLDGRDRDGGVTLGTNGTEDIVREWRLDL